MTASKILILHYRDTSKYPPIINLIDYIENQTIKFQYISGSRMAMQARFLNSLSYFSFLIRTFFSLLFTKNSIVYYESISATPVAIYFFLFPHSRRKLFIHYHEYFSIEEYRRQSFYERLGRKLEGMLFERASWISHTNEDRLALFQKDFPSISKNTFNTMPNYPPSSWIESNRKIESKGKVFKLLHIGALSKESLYLESLLGYFGDDKRFDIDFYSHRFSDEVRDLIERYDNCNICGSIPYQDIPSLKGKYDVGLVLYNGSSLNFTYNAPNKIFEYLALGLDVWCSDKLLTAKEYERQDCYPKMLMVDYENLPAFDIEKALDKTGLSYSPSPYVCEPVYEKLVQKIMD